MNIKKLPVKLTLTVKRPNGEVEHIVHPTLKSITEAQFKQIQRDTKAAGRGNVFDYKIDYEDVKRQPRQMCDIEKAMTLNGRSM